jgi:hypothetical protein
MPKKIQNTTKADLISVPLPNHAATYTVISHQFVIDYAFQALANAGFGIVDEEYRCTADGQIAQGIYKLNFNNDPELSMMFAWTNSYNKQVKFKCVVGAYINKTGSVMISGDIGSWVRKHTGSADTETKQTIDDYIANAHMYYTQLCSDKAAMETVMLNKRKQSQLLGVLFAEYEILTTEQASMVRDQMKKPNHVFASSDSLWAFYNYVTNALQLSHPKTWMEDQRILHYFISTIGNFQQCSTPAQVVQPINTVSEVIEDVVDPNQINLLDAIAEAEAENNSAADLEADQIDEDIRYAANDDTYDDTSIEIFEEQSGTNEVKNEEILYQSEEVVENATEDTEVPFDIDEDDDAVLGSLLVPIDNPDPVATVEDYLASKNEEEISPEKSEDIFPQTEAIDFHNNVVLDVVDLNETTKMSVVIVEEPTSPCAVHDTETEKEENLSNEFAEEDNFDLTFDDDTEEDPGSIPDFF